MNKATFVGWLARWRSRGLSRTASSQSADTARAVPDAPVEPTLVDDLRRRLGTASDAPSPPAASPQTPEAPASNTPAKRTAPALRGIEQWLGALGLLLCAALVVWVALAAWDVLSTAKDWQARRMQPPSLLQYPPTIKTSLLPAERLSADLQRALSPEEDPLKRAIENVATFENARAEQPLRAASATVQSVVPGSAAELARVEVGDVVKLVNGKEAGFVWDVYKLLTDRPVRLVELTLLRGNETTVASLQLPEGDSFNMTNHGLLFSVPDSIRFIGRVDVDRISEQLRSGYIERLPEESQSAYIDGLLDVTNSLVSNLTTLQAAAPGAGNYVRSEEVLGWYHRSYVSALSSYRAGAERLLVRQAESLEQLALSLLACTVAGLVALGLTLRRLWSV